MFMPLDLAEQIDAIQEEEIDPESLLIQEMYLRQLRGDLNSIDDVRITFETLLGADGAVSVDFMYNISFTLMQSSDPIGLMARNYAIKQNQMIEEQRLLCFEDMARLHRQVKERSLADTAQLAKDMQAVNTEREKEFLKLKNEYRLLCVSNTLLSSDHESLKLRQSALTGVEGYAQYQQELQDAQRKLELKTAECKVYQEQLLKLSDAIRMQSVGAPFEAAPAPAEEDLEPGPGWDHTSHARAIEDAANAWGVNRAQEVHNNGWGDSPAESSFSDTSHATQTGGATQIYQRWPGGHYLKGGGKGFPSNPILKGGKRKRGRDHGDNARHVSQKSWTKDGKSVSEDWSRSHHVHAHFRKLSLGAIESLLKTLKLADSSFQQTVRDVNFERWHEVVNTTFLYLHKDLGIPDKHTVSPHSYFQAAQWQCNNVIDMLSRSELAYKSYNMLCCHERNTFEDDLTSIAVPTNVMQLGDNKTLNDFRIAKHDLSQQELLTRSYTSRRDNFYKVTIVNNDKRPTRTFLDKATHIQVKRDFHRFPNQEPLRFFKQLFDEAFKFHYNKIINEIWPLPHITPRLSILSAMQRTFVFYTFTTSIALVCAPHLRVTIRRLAFRP